LATRLYAWAPGQTRVLEGVGAAASSTLKMNITIDLATNLVNEGATTRGFKREEVIMFLEDLKQHLLRTNWPPA
jgi:hypothetical protein